MKALLKLAGKIRDAIPRSLRAGIRFFRYHRYFYFSQLRPPRTFNEHVHVRKLFDNDARFALYADKAGVKDIVRRELGEDWLIPTLWSGKRFPEQFPGWPLPFVLKANFGSGFNQFVRRPEDLDWARLKQVAEDWTARTWHTGEAWYNEIPRRLLAEPVIGDGDVPDYKFFVFGGEVAYIQLDRGRFGDHRRTFFCPAWNRQDITYGYPPEECTIPPPPHLSDMVRAASILGRPFTFVRVDLYDLPEGPKFGEITFAPALGFKRFQPFAIDVELGRRWKAAAARSEPVPNGSPGDLGLA